MKICKNCGAAIEDETFHVRCPKCGAKTGSQAGTEEAADHGAAMRAGKVEGAGASGSSSLPAGAIIGIALGMVAVIILVVLVVQMSGRQQLKSLYGEWEDEKGILSLTFREDGTLRVGAGGGLIGADVLSYRALDEDTLELIPDVRGVQIDVITIQMDYELDGDTLTVILFDIPYELERQ